MRYFIDRGETGIINFNTDEELIIWVQKVFDENEEEDTPLNKPYNVPSALHYVNHFCGNLIIISKATQTGRIKSGGEPNVSNTPQPSRRWESGVNTPQQVDKRLLEMDKFAARLYLAYLQWELDEQSTLAPANEEFAGWEQGDVEHILTMMGYPLPSKFIPIPGLDDFEKLPFTADMWLSPGFDPVYHMQMEGYIS